MKIIFAALVVAFTVGFASPSFADDNEPPCPDPLLDSFLSAVLLDGETPEPEPISKAEAEHIERCQAEAEAEAKVLAERQAVEKTKAEALAEARAKESAERQAAKNEEAEAKARTEAEILAEFENATAKVKSRVGEAFTLPLEPENHCEIIKAVFAMQVTAYLFSLEKINYGNLSYSSRKDAKKMAGMAAGKLQQSATIKMAVCENYY